MTGTFDEELTKRIEHADHFQRFKDVAVRQVYCAKPVVEVEACGFEVISGLLSAFVGAVENKAKNPKKPPSRARTLLSLMPGGNASFDTMSEYERLIRVTDFVSGMTDSYAVDLYQRIRGISLP